MATLIAERLRTGILRGEYVTGQPLREVELCSILGASRIPVREALHRLAGEGLVELRPNRGAFVAAPSKSEVSEIGEICRMLETHLMTLSVPSIRPDALARAQACLDELDGIDDPLEWSHVNSRFHLNLYESADRPLTVEMLTSLRARADRATLLLVSDKEQRTLLNHEHRAILTAVHAGREVLASTLLGAHLRGGRDRVMRLIDEH
jgi:DNA-binding GntR family transcriptional regulator